MLHELKVGNDRALQKWINILEAEWADDEFKAAPDSSDFKNFSTALSHEINQPLTFIKIALKTTIQDIRNGSLDTAELVSDCNEALKQIQRITIFLNKLRNISN